MLRVAQTVNTFGWVYPRASWPQNVKHCNTSDHFVSYLWQSSWMILGMAEDAAAVTAAVWWWGVLDPPAWGSSTPPSPRPAHWFQVYVTQGQSMSCKTGMLQVFITFMELNLMCNTCVELGSVTFACARGTDRERAVLIGNISQWSIKQITYACDQYLNWSSGLTGAGDPIS